MFVNNTTEWIVILLLTLYHFMETTSVLRLWMTKCHYECTGSWDPALCNLAEVYCHFRGQFCPHLQDGRVSQASRVISACTLAWITEGGGRVVLWNTNKLLPDYMASHPRWWYLLYSSLWGPQILQTQLVSPNNVT
jgi:hypothetical protein